MEVCQSRQATRDEETLDDRNAVVERTNPSRGPISGGPEIGSQVRSSLQPPRPMHEIRG